MQEAAACAFLKARFEAAGFSIVENQTYEDDGIRFEIDGFDPDRRVGYEYVTSEAGDGWDVDDSVIAALAQRRANGTLYVLVVDEAEAPDEAALAERADAFLADLPEPKAAKPAAKNRKPAATKPPAKKPAATKRSAAKKTAPKAAAKPSAKKRR